MKSISAEEPVMKEALYADPMVEIFEDTLILKRYYLLWLGRKVVPFAEIASAAATELKPFNGRFRFQGSDNLKTWWPLDWARPNRRWAFIIRRKNRRSEIGLTVENYDTVLGLFHQKLGNKFHDARQNR
jgi:hypothetical protein